MLRTLRRCKNNLESSPAGSVTHRTAYSHSNTANLPWLTQNLCGKRNSKNPTAQARQEKVKETAGDVGGTQTLKGWEASALTLEKVQQTLGCTAQRRMEPDKGPVLLSEAGDFEDALLVALAGVPAPPPYLSQTQVSKEVPL